MLRESTVPFSMNISGVNTSSSTVHLVGLVLLEQRSPPGNVDETAVSIVELLHSNGMGMLVKHNFNRLAPAARYTEDVVHADFQPFGDYGDDSTCLVLMFSSFLEGMASRMRSLSCRS
jgi:hypothetical protein